MARLMIKTAGVGSQWIELKMGANRVGRSPDTDFPIAHPTVSGLHCEFLLADGAVILRDLESTNGTYVDGKRVSEATLSTGQTIRLGDVEMMVETTEIKVAIPKFFDPELPAPPVVLHDGSLLCPRHPQARASHRCTKCAEILCEACVHRLRRKGSKRALLLCPVCSGPVELIGGAQKPKKKSLFARVGETVKMKLTRAIHLHGNNR